MSHPRLLWVQVQLTVHSLQAHQTPGRGTRETEAMQMLQIRTQIDKIWMNLRNWVSICPSLSVACECTLASL